MESTKIRILRRQIDDLMREHLMVRAPMCPATAPYGGDLAEDDLQGALRRSLVRWENAADHDAWAAWAACHGYLDADPPDYRAVEVWGLRQLRAAIRGTDD